MSNGLRSQDRVYVSNVNGIVTFIGIGSGTLTGTLTGMVEPLGACSDSHGHIYVVVRKKNDRRVRSRWDGASRDA